MKKFEPFFPHETRIRIPMHMVDLGNVVYQSRYLDLYHEARDSYMNAAGYDYGLLMNQGVHLATVSADVRFRRPVKYLETAIIETRIAWTRNRSMQMVQRVSKETEGEKELCNTLEITLVCIGEDFSTISMPKDFLETLSLFQQQATES